MNRLLLGLAAAVLAVGLAAPSRADDYPQRPIHLIVAFGPGGGADIVGRILADALQKKLGQPFVVENKPGAGGILGNDVVARAPADGYALGIMTAGQVIAAVTTKTMPYDPQAAFAPVGQIATASLMIVTRPDFPANDVKELIAYAKAHPGKVVFASPGFAATQHFAGELFKQSAKIDLLHVPFRSTPETINAVLGKHADIMFDTVSALIGQVQSGQLKALAVTGKDRFPAVPNVPAAIESGLLPGYDVTTWYGLFATHGTPPDVIAKLNKALNESLADPDVAKKLVTVGVVVKSSTPQAFGDFMASEYKRWNAVRKAAGIPQK
jgi:tripartite-type tricarboxylate transporter receptor subunit TctC